MADDNAIGMFMVTKMFEFFVSVLRSIFNYLINFIIVIFIEIVDIILIELFVMLQKQLGYLLH